MPRCAWSDLPTEVLRGVTVHTGAVRRVDPVLAGEHSDVTVTLDTERGRFFVKGMRTEPATPDLWSLRREGRINPYVTCAYAPRLLWQVEAGGWLVLGFEHVKARHADYTPGSPDLEVLAAIVRRFQTM